MRLDVVGAALVFAWWFESRLMVGSGAKGSVSRRDIRTTAVYTAALGAIPFWILLGICIGVLSPVNSGQGVPVQIAIQFPLVLLMAKFIGAMVAAYFLETFCSTVGIALDPASEGRSRMRKTEWIVALVVSAAFVGISIATNG